MPNPEKDVQPFPSITNEVTSLIRNAHAIADTLPIVMAALGAARRLAQKSYGQFLEKRGELQGQDDDTKHYKVPFQYHPELLHLKRDYESAKLGQLVIPQTFIVSLVALFDAFVGRLLRCLVYIKPELMKPSERKLAFADLIQFPSIDEAKDYMIEKEIESLLRQSHTDQFEWLEGSFGLPLHKDLPSWATFVEVTERRNLFVHTGGVVSSQYLTVCAKHGVPLDPDVKVGQQLDVSPEYFASAYRCIIEIAVKLAQVLWRKISPDALEDADRSLIETTYDLLVLGQYDLAAILLQFTCTTLKRFSSDENRRIFIINLAQAHKWMGQATECKQALDREDWSSASDKFALGVAALKDDFDRACAIMKRIGPDGQVREADYKSWPLFQEFRKSAEFARTYQEVFGQPFTTTAKAPRQRPDTGA